MRVSLRMGSPKAPIGSGQHRREVLRFEPGGLYPVVPTTALPMRSPRDVTPLLIEDWSCGNHSALSQLALVVCAEMRPIADRQRRSEE